MPQMKAIAPFQQFICVFLNWYFLELCKWISLVSAALLLTEKLLQLKEQCVHFALSIPPTSVLYLGTVFSFKLFTLESSVSTGNVKSRITWNNQVQFWLVLYKKQVMQESLFTIWKSLNEMSSILQTTNHPETYSLEGSSQFLGRPSWIPNTHRWGFCNHSTELKARVGLFFCTDSYSEGDTK